MARRRKPRSPFVLIFAGLALILVALGWLLANGNAAANDSATTSSADFVSAIPAAVDFPAPDLQLSDLQGNPVALTDLRGQYVLVNNWATWCPPCRAEMPELEAFYQAHKGENFVIIGISAGDTQAQVVDFVNRMGISFPMWLDPGEKALRAFRTNSLPSSFVIDPQGQVRLAWTGAISKEMLEKHVAPLFQQ
ncbi:MAG: TlpA family protein disulfide reductase [Anaerolineae bacterium]|nr:MAG: TlpA family protein disulfide reductase [Anaerolineae bacterium]